MRSHPLESDVLETADDWKERRPTTVGYKQSDVGVIPKDWEVKLLPEVCRFRGGKAHEQHISDIGQYVCVNSKFISTDGAVRKYSSANFCAAKRNDVLMVMSDLPNGRALAKAYLVEQDELYAVNQRVCALTAYRDCPEYLFYVLNRNPYFLRFDDGVSQTHLLNHVFQKCPLPMPPTAHEQRAIAEALSEVDGLLGALDRLIAKKHVLKQAAMQQLFTGSIRLPGFCEDWRTFSLNEVASRTAGFWGLESDDGGHPRVAHVIRAGDITPDGGLTATATRYYSEAEFAKAHCKLGDVVITGSGSVGKVWWCDGRANVAASNFVRVLRPMDQRVNGLFLSQALRSEATQRLMVEHIATGVMANLGSSFFTTEWLSLPPLPEQAAIAEVLGEMDAELAGLDQRREKTRAIKQGMMQELLTGRTRLV
jgi:type I restriction enzyme, S subunit